MDKILDKGCPPKALFSQRHLEAKVSSLNMDLRERAASRPQHMVPWSSCSNISCRNLCSLLRATTSVE